MSFETRGNDRRIVLGISIRLLGAFALVGSGVGCSSVCDESTNEASSSDSVTMPGFGIQIVW